jgi:hypothetical protein
MTAIPKTTKITFELALERIFIAKVEKIPAWVKIPQTVVLLIFLKIFGITGTYQFTRRPNVRNTRLREG